MEIDESKSFSTNNKPANDNMSSNNSSSSNNNNNNNNSETNGTLNGLNQSTGSKSSILNSSYDTDVVRLIGQHLNNLGYKRTVNSLLEESGLSGLDHPVATKFHRHILAGEWDKANSLVDEIATHCKGDKQTNSRGMRLILTEQKYLEIIEDNQPLKALRCLRLEITPLTNDVKYIQHLASLLMCKSTSEVRAKANWPGTGLESRQNLIEKFQQFIPPLIMLPPKRLNTLLSQAVELQRERCTFHIPGSGPDHIDLKTDHVCSADKFPLNPRQEFDNHQVEVWFCSFSNDGLKLATGGIGGKIKIWDVNPKERNLTERCTFDCAYSVSCLSWSPNDVYLLACGAEEKSDLWLWNVDKEILSHTIEGSEEDSSTTCTWHPSGEAFASASTKGTFNIFDLNTNRKGTRDGVRAQCISFLHNDPNYILASDTQNRIKAYAICDKEMSFQPEEEDILEERHLITSFTIDKDDRYIAVNIMNQGVHLWDYKLKTLLRMFPGVCQRNFTIYSSFSSPDASFLASGSEDGKIYIYNVHREQPIAILHGHSRCVNCVSWNPKYPELLASVSDDRRVRLWAPDTGEDS